MQIQVGDTVRGTLWCTFPSERTEGVVVELDPRNMRVMITLADGSHAFLTATPWHGDNVIEVVRKANEEADEPLMVAATV